jgi:hypothetical protein
LGLYPDNKPLRIYFRNMDYFLTEKKILNEYKKKIGEDIDIVFEQNN